MANHNKKRYFTQGRKIPQLRPMTCIIGALCAEGVVIIADTKVLHESQASHESKIHLLFDQRIVISGAGSNIVIDYIIDDLKEKETGIDNTSFLNIIKTIEDSVSHVKSKYYARLGEEFQIDLLVAGLDNYSSGETQLRWIRQNGISEKIPKYHIIGHGAPYALTLFSLMFDQMLTAQETALLGTFAISTISSLGLDQTVGISNFGPEAIILKPNDNPKFMNTASQPFIRINNVAKSLDFKKGLVTSIWDGIPQAYTGYFMESR